MPIIKKWTDEDIARLQTLIEGGATLLRAAASLGRSTTSVQRMARKLGKRFPGAREVRAGFKARSAGEEKER